MADEPLSMLQLDINLADAEKVPEVPAGKYVAEVQNVEVRTSQAGRQYWSIKFVIPQEELPNSVAEFYEDGAVLYWNRQLVPQGNDRRFIFNLQQLYRNLGLDTNLTSIDPNEWMGRRTKLVVRMGQYQGEPRAEIASMEPADEDAPVRQEPTKTAPRGRRR